MAAVCEANGGACSVAGSKRKFEATMEDAAEWDSAASHRLMGVAFFASALMGVIPLQQLLQRLQQLTPVCQAVPLGAASRPPAQRSKRRAAGVPCREPAAQPDPGAAGEEAVVAKQAPPPLHEAGYRHPRQLRQQHAQQEEACELDHAGHLVQVGGSHAGATEPGHLKPMDVEEEPAEVAASPPLAGAAPSHAAACALGQQPSSGPAGRLSPTTVQEQRPYQSASQDQQPADEAAGCAQHGLEPQQAAMQMPTATLPGGRKLSRMQLRQQLLAKRAAQAAAGAAAATPAPAAPASACPPYNCPAPAVAAEGLPVRSAEPWPAADGGASCSSREVQPASKRTRGNRLLGLVVQHQAHAAQQAQQQAEPEMGHGLDAQGLGCHTDKPVYQQMLNAATGRPMQAAAATTRSGPAGPYQAPHQQQQEHPWSDFEVQDAAAPGGEELAERHVSMPVPGVVGGPLSDVAAEAGPPSPAAPPACGGSGSQRRLTQSPIRYGRDAAALPELRGVAGSRGPGGAPEEQAGARQQGQHGSLPQESLAQLEVFGQQPEESNGAAEEQQQAQQRDELAGGRQAQQAPEQAEQQQGATPPTPTMSEAPTLPVAPQAARAPLRTQAATPAGPAGRTPSAAEVLEEGLALAASRRAAEQQTLLVELRQQQEPCQRQDAQQEPQQAQHSTPPKAVGCSRASLTAACASGASPGQGGDDTPGPSPLTGGAHRSAAAALQRVSQLVSDLAVGDDEEEEAAPSPHPWSGRSDGGSGHSHVSKRRRCLLSVISQQGQAASPSKETVEERQLAAGQQHGEQPRQEELPSAGLPIVNPFPGAAAAGEQEQAPSLSPSPANLIALAPAALASSSPHRGPAAASPLDAFPGFWVAQPPAAAPPSGCGSDGATGGAAVTPAARQGAGPWEGSGSQEGQPDGSQATPDLGCLGPKQAQQAPAAGSGACVAAAEEAREGGEEGARQEQRAQGGGRRERKVRFSLPSPAEVEEAAAGWGGESLMDGSGAYSHRLPRLGSGASCRPGTPSRPPQPGRAMQVPAPPAFSRFGSTAFRKYSGPAGRRAALLSAAVMTADAGGSVCFALPPVPPPPPSPVGETSRRSGSNACDPACPAPGCPSSSEAATGAAAAAAEASADTCAAAVPGGGAVDGDAAGWPATLLGSTGDGLGGGLRGEAGAVEIPRRLRHPQPAARCRRPSMDPLPSPKDSALQDLREAFLNARLAGCWQRGEAWARLDLAGVELEAGEGHALAQRLDKLWAVLCEARGSEAAQAVEARLEGEWRHLQHVRQRYAARAAGTAEAPAAAEQSPIAAPEASPGSHGAAATPRPAGRAPAPRGILKQPSPLAAAKPGQPPHSACSPGASPPYHLLTRQQQQQQPSPVSATPPPPRHQQQPPADATPLPHHLLQRQEQQQERQVRYQEQQVQYQEQQEQYQERPKPGVAVPGAAAGEASPMDICGPSALSSQPGASAPTSAGIANAPEGREEDPLGACQGMASPNRQPEVAVPGERSADGACTAVLLAGPPREEHGQERQAAELGLLSPAGPQPVPAALCFEGAAEAHESAAGGEDADGPEPSLQLTPDHAGPVACSAAAAGAPVEEVGGLVGEGPLELTPDAAVELTPGPAPSRGLKMLQSAGRLAAARAGTAGATPARLGPSPTARVALTFAGQHHSSALDTPQCGGATWQDSMATGTAWAAGSAGGAAAQRAKATRGARLLQAGLQAGGQCMGVSHALAIGRTSSGGRGGRLAAVASGVGLTGEPGTACDCMEVA
ncbi:hypothetical protein N2152v2_001989 [Parachlorella kessleri]